MSDDDVSDIALVRRTVDGDQAAFNAIMHRYKERVFRIARRSLDDPDEAYDATQEVFVSAWRNLTRFDEARSLLAWLAKITINECRDRRRRRAVRAFFFRAAPIDGPEAARLADDDQLVERTVMARDELRQAQREIAALPDNLREAFILCVIEEMPQKEVAAILGVSVKAVETRVARARRVLTIRSSIQ